MPSRKPYPNDADKRGWKTRILRAPAEVIDLLDEALHFAALMGAHSSVAQIEAVSVEFINTARTELDHARSLDTTPEAEFRDAVRTRDEWECVDCETHQRLEVHHIIPRKWAPDRVLDVTNGVTLCSECHAKVQPKWRDYVERLQRIVETHEGAAR